MPNFFITCLGCAEAVCRLPFAYLQIIPGTNNIASPLTNANYNKRIRILFISYLLYALFYLTLIKPQSLTVKEGGSISSYPEVIRG